MCSIEKPKLRPIIFFQLFFPSQSYSFRFKFFIDILQKLHAEEREGLAVDS